MGQTLDKHRLAGPLGFKHLFGTVFLRSCVSFLLQSRFSVRSAHVLQCHHPGRYTASGASEFDYSLGCSYLDCDFGVLDKAPGTSRSTNTSTALVLEE